MRGILAVGFLGVVLLAWAMFAIKADTAQQAERLADLKEERQQLERDVNTLELEASHLAGVARSPDFAEKRLGLVPVTADQRVSPSALPTLLKSEAETPTAQATEAAGIGTPAPAAQSIAGRP